MTVAERRLTKVEASLTPREAVLRWLAKAQQFPSLPDHARSIVDLPDAEAPLTRITRAVTAAVRDARKGDPPGVLGEAVHRATGDAVFLFVLVVSLNGAAVEIARIQGLRAAALTFWMAALMGDPLSGDPAARETEPDHAAELHRAWQSWRTTLEALAEEVRVETEARAALEERYLDGRRALFAHERQSWLDVADHVDHLSRLADLLPPAARAKPDRESGGDDQRAQTAHLVAVRAKALADDARVRAFEILGDRRRAVAILERRWRHRASA